MIDFHSHIIPDIDDGSRNVEETFDLLKEAKSVGFDTIISTSHYMEDIYESDVNERKKWVSALIDGIHKESIDIRLYLGNEIYATQNIIKLIKSGKACSINKSKYVLFEYPINIEPLDTEDIVYKLKENDFIPVLAHPERYVFFQNNLEKVYNLAQKGVLMQSNYGSILGLYGKSAEYAVRKLLESNMIQFLGSDVHRKNSIYPKIPKAMEEIKKIIGEDKLNLLTTENPGLVLKNKPINREDAIFPKYSIREKILMKL